MERDGDSSLFSLQIDDGDGDRDGEWSQQLAGGGVAVVCVDRRFVCGAKTATVAKLRGLFCSFFS